MTNAELYEALAADYRRGVDLLADDYPAAAAYEADMADWCAAMAAGYQAHGESWLPF